MPASRNSAGLRAMRLLASSMVPPTRYGIPHDEYDMYGPRSSTRTSAEGSRRRATAAALIPAALPPTTARRATVPPSIAMGSAAAADRETSAATPERYVSRFGSRPLRAPDVERQLLPEHPRGHRAEIGMLAGTRRHRRRRWVARRRHRARRRARPSRETHHPGERRGPRRGVLGGRSASWGSPSRPPTTGCSCPHMGGIVGMRQTRAGRHPRHLSMAYNPASACAWPSTTTSRRAGIHHQGLQREVVSDGSSSWPGRPGAAGVAAGPGGQERLPAEARRHRRVPAAAHGARPREDRRGHHAHLVGVRRHPPGRHRGAALLRGEAPPQGPPRHPRVPRGPAGHRRGHPGGAHQRPRRRRQEPVGGHRGAGRPRTRRTRRRPPAGVGRRRRPHRLRQPRRHAPRAHRPQRGRAVGG